MAMLNNQRVISQLLGGVNHQLCSGQHPSKESGLWSSKLWSTGQALFLVFMLFSTPVIRSSDPDSAFPSTKAWLKQILGVESHSSHSYPCHHPPPQNFQAHLGLENWLDLNPIVHPSSKLRQFQGAQPSPMLRPVSSSRPDVEITAKLGALFFDLLVDELFLFRDGRRLIHWWGRWRNRHWV